MAPQVRTPRPGGSGRGCRRCAAGSTEQRPPRSRWHRRRAAALASALKGTSPMKIDFVSDVACPWCAVGLASLEQALKRFGAPVELHFQPFELNPTLGPEGAD